MLIASMHMGLTFCYKYQEHPQTRWLRQGVPSATLPLSERWERFSISDSNREMALLIDMSKSKPQHGSNTQIPELPSERAPWVGRADAPPEKTGLVFVRGSQTSLWFSFNTHQSPAGDDIYMVTSANKCIDTLRSSRKKVRLVYQCRR